MEPSFTPTSGEERGAGRGGASGGELEARANSSGVESSKLRLQA